MTRKKTAMAGKSGAAVMPFESYTPERKAEFLLSNAVSREDYKRAKKAVEALGLDPDKIPHTKN